MVCAFFDFVEGLDVYDFGRVGDVEDGCYFVAGASGDGEEAAGVFSGGLSVSFCEVLKD